MRILILALIVLVGSVNSRINVKQGSITDFITMIGMLLQEKCGNSQRCYLNQRSLNVGMGKAGRPIILCARELQGLAQFHQAGPTQRHGDIVRVPLEFPKIQATYNIPGTETEVTFAANNMQIFVDFDKHQNGFSLRDISLKDKGDVALDVPGGKKRFLGWIIDFAMQVVDWITEIIFGKPSKALPPAAGHGICIPGGHRDAGYDVRMDEYGHVRVIPPPKSLFMDLRRH